MNEFTRFMAGTVLRTEPLLEDRERAVLDRTCRPFEESPATYTVASSAIRAILSQTPGCGLYRRNCLSLNRTGSGQNPLRPTTFAPIDPKAATLSSSANEDRMARAHNPVPAGAIIEAHQPLPFVPNRDCRGRPSHCAHSPLKTCSS